MITVQQLSEEFNARHDFEYEDIDFLHLNYPTIGFFRIPEAWVCPIDETLRKMTDESICTIRSISQVMGHLVIDYCPTSEQNRVLFATLDRNLKLLDIDLHDELGEGIVLH
jgi:hypothetical protein